MADANNDQFILDNLKKLGQPKKQTGVTQQPTLKRPAAEVQNLMNVLDTAKNVKTTSKPEKNSVVLSTELKNLATTTTVNPVGFVASKLIKPLEVLSVPRNAVISTIREVTDILDSDPNTKASWGDWYNQTKDPTFGFGKAFPMKGWTGRVVGFLGDVLLDPLTYATLGGTVAKGATFIDDAGRTVATRSVLGKTVIGREGRQKLAAFTRQRIEKLAKDGHVAAGALSKNQVDEIVRDIAAQGKRALPKFVADDIGIKGPGVYYFGSRVKVPKSDVFGSMVEKGITKMRLGFANSDLAQPLIRAITPKGVGRIAEFGPETVRNYRIALANGSLEPEEARKALDTLQFVDNKRINVARYSSTTSDAVADELDDALKTATPAIDLLDNVIDPATVTDNVDDIAKARRVRAVLDSLLDRLRNRAQEVGAREPGRVEGYFPRVETEQMARQRLKEGEAVMDDLVYGPPVDSRTRSSFRERTLQVGDNWFGHTLTQDQMNAKSLNNLARNPTAEWRVSTGREGFNFDVFETDAAKVMNGYIRQYAEQMATYDMVDEIRRTRPDWLQWMDTTFELDPEFVRSQMVIAPKEAFENSVASLRNWSATANDAAENMQAATEKLTGTLRTRRDVLARQEILDEDIVQIVAALDEALKQEAAALQAVEQAFSGFDGMLENVDGLSNYGLVVAQRRKLAQSHAELAARAAKLGEMSKEEVVRLMDDFADHARRVARFEREIDSLGDIQDIMPAFMNMGDVDAGSLYDSINRFVKLRYSQKDFPPVGTSEKVFPATWNNQRTASVNRLGNDEMVLNRLLSDDLSDQEMEDIAWYLFSRFSAVSKKFQKDFNNKNFSGTVAGEWQDAWKSWTGRLSDDAKRLGMAPAPKMDVPQIRQFFIDRMHGLMAYDQYILVRAVMDEYGLTLGDDVIDEILRRQAEPILTYAIKNNDMALIARLTDPQNVYGRVGGTKGPFSKLRLVERQREVRNDVVNSLQPVEVKAPRVANVSEETKQYNKLPPKKRETYKQYKDDLKASRSDYVRDLRNTENDLRAVKAEQETIAAKFEPATTRIRNEYGVSGEAAGRPLRKRFEAAVNLFYADPTKIEQRVEDLIRKSLPVEQFGPNAAEETINRWRQEFGDALRIVVSADAADDPTYIKEVIGVMVDGVGQHVAHTAEVAVHGLDIEADAIFQTIHILRDKIILIDDRLVNVTPDVFFAGESGQARYVETLLTSEGVQRAVQPGIGNIPENKGSVDALKATIRDLMDNDFYPIAKAQQNSANIAHILSDLDTTADILPGIRFSPEEWDQIVSGKEIPTALGRKVRAIVKHAQNNFERINPDEYVRLGGEVSDEYALRTFVQKVLTDRPELAVSSSVAQARRQAIQKAFEESEGYGILQKVDELRARAVAADIERKAKNPRKIVDDLGRTNDEIADANTAISQEYDEWTSDAAKVLDDILEQAKRVRGQETGGLRSVVEPQIRPAETLGIDAEGASIVEGAPAFKPGVDNAPLNYVKGPRRRVISRDEAATETLLQISENKKSVSRRIVNALEGPIERKSNARLEAEIRFLQELKNNKIDVDGVSFSAAIRERSRALKARGAAGELTAQERKQINTFGETVAKRVGETETKNSQRSIAESEFNRFFGPDSQQAASEFDKSGRYGWSDYVEEQEVIEREGRWTSGAKKAKPPKKMPVPRTGENRVPSGITDEGLQRLENDLKAVVQPSDVGAKQAELDRARAVVATLEDRYNQAASVINSNNPQAMQDVQDALGILQKVARTLEGKIKVERMNETGLEQIRNGTHEMYNSLKLVQKRLREARQVALYVGDKESMDVIDQILLAQVKAESEFFDTYMKMGQAQFDNQMLGAAEGMISAGGILREDGRIVLPSGVVVDGVPPDMVAGAVKRARATFENWEELGKYFPDLQGSPEFMAMWNAGARMESPEWVRKLAYYIGDYTKLWKAFAVLSPGFHVRNSIANAVTYTMADGSMDNLIMVTPIYVAWTKARKAGTSWSDFLKTVDPKLVPALETAHLGMLGSGGGIFTETFKEATGSKSSTSFLLNNWLVRKNQAVGQAADNYMRFALAFDTAMKGGDVGLAQARVKRYYFDYEDLSTADQVMRQIVPFWLWTSRNLTMQIQNMWLNPRPYLIYESFKRNFEDSETPVPPFVREMGGFRLPFGQGMYLMPDLGFNRVEKDLQAFINPKEFLNKANPLIKIPAEQALGENVFTGTEFKTPQDRLAAILRNAAPPVGQSERLFGKDGLSQLNAWLSYLGSPVRKYN